MSPLPHVLLVDDEETVVDTLSAVIRRFGYAVTAVRSEEAATSALARDEFDLLVTDLDLGLAGDGISIVRYAKRHNPNMPIIVLTGYPTTAMAIDVQSMHVIRSFTKPCNLQDLRTTIARAIGGGQGPSAVSVRDVRPEDGKR